jgi:hypothetical protein
MISNVLDRRRSSTAARRVEKLRDDLLESFYDRGLKRQSLLLAARLEKALKSSPDYLGSIRAEEIYALIAEVRGDIERAARFREAEVRKILELHSLFVNTPSWEYVARQYDFSDVSDRLDLLAALYEKLGDSERAIATLLESKHYCESHGVPFDGQDVLAEFLAAHNAPS